MGAPDSDARRLSKVIEHPIRARIIELLGDKGPLGWKEISQEVGVKTGALYHHLDALEGLVERDGSKKYFLTKSGRIVYSKTSQSRDIESVRQAAVDIQKEGSGRRAALSVFLPRSLLAASTNGPRRSALMLAMFAVSFGAYMAASGSSPILYYLSPSPGLAPTVGYFGVSLAALFALCFASARAAFKASVDPLQFAAATSFSYLPVVAFSAVALIPSASSFFAAYSVGFTLILVFFQSWSAAILGAGLSVASGVRVERTLLVSLAVLYATMVVMLVQGKAI